MAITNAGPKVIAVLLSFHAYVFKLKGRKIAHMATVTCEGHHSCESHASAENSANRLLVVSAATEDRLTLSQLLVFHSCPRHWTSSVREAAEWLRLRSARVVICDEQLADGHWQELWDLLRWTPAPPVFIVSASWADDRLWAEVLNLGAYDVLAKPYRKDEVDRVLQHAYQTFGSRT